MSREIVTDLDGKRYEVQADHTWQPLSAPTSSDPNGQHPIHPPETAATLQPPPAEVPDLAREQRILDLFKPDVRRLGVVGEDRLAATTFLALISRLLPDPVSVAVKGTSSSGKSYTVEATSRFFPRSAFMEFTAMSERALVYMKEEYKHRTLILYEAVALREGLDDNLTSYFVRSLLSEGRISYPVTVRDQEGNWTTRTIVKEGPTNVILTTTQTSLHGENETRLLSIATNDTRDQTRAIFHQLARETREPVDLSRWHELQEWLQTQENRVAIPYARFLAETVPPVAVRLRRDFGALLNLIRAHAILQQACRDRDDQGRIIATEDDYQVVRGLVADLVSEGVGATVSQTTRETVECVRTLYGAQAGGVTADGVARDLLLDKSTAWRRLKAARERGYLKNLEERRGRPGRYAPDEPMPDEVDLLPLSLQPRNVQGDEPAGQADGCTVAVPPGGIETEPMLPSSFEESETATFDDVPDYMGDA